MAGRGPAPKPASKRARRNQDNIPLKVVELCNVVDMQPALPEFKVMEERDGEIHECDFQWHERTRQWWDMWGESPLSEDFTAADWEFLLDTAVLHTQFWRGDVKVAAELRLRVAKFGQTIEDRQRLRITFSNADESEARAQSATERRAASSRERARRRVQVVNA